MTPDLDQVAYSRPIYDGLLIDACYDIGGIEAALITIAIWCGVAVDANFYQQTWEQ